MSTCVVARRVASPEILVPVANPETADRLLHTAVDLARDRDGEILVLHVVAVPMQASLEQARDGIDEERAAVEYAVDVARDAGVPVTGRVRFGRDVAGGVLDVAAERSVETILLGWRGRPRRRDVVLGSFVDTILSDAPCDVLVKRIDRERGAVSSVLVPVAGGPNTDYAAETAGVLARQHDARVELVSIVAPDADESAVERARDALNGADAAVGAVEAVEQNVVRGSDVIETIVERSSGHDVTIVGAAEGGLFGRVLVGEVPERAARGVDGTVLVAKRHRAVPGALWRRVTDRVRTLGRRSSGDGPR